MTIDIKDDIPYDIALTYLLKVIKAGRISNNGHSYCYSTIFKTSIGDIVVNTREYRKSDCFLIFKK